MLIVEANGQKHTFEDGPVTIGRSSACDVVVGGAGVSREHLVLTVTGDQWTASDRSTHGTYSSMVRIGQTEAVNPPANLRLGSPEGPQVRLDIESTKKKEEAEIVENHGRSPKSGAKRRRTVVAGVLIIALVAAGLYARDWLADDIPTSLQLLLEESSTSEVSRWDIPKIDDDGVSVPAETPEASEVPGLRLGDVQAFIAKHEIDVPPAAIPDTDLTLEVLNTRVPLGVFSLLFRREGQVHALMLADDSSTTTLRLAEGSWLASTRTVSNDFDISVSHFGPPEAFGTEAGDDSPAMTLAATPVGEDAGIILAQSGLEGSSNADLWYCGDKITPTAPGLESINAAMTRLVDGVGVMITGFTEMNKTMQDALDLLSKIDAAIAVFTAGAQQAMDEIAALVTLFAAEISFIAGKLMNFLGPALDLLFAFGAAIATGAATEVVSLTALSGAQELMLLGVAVAASQLPLVAAEAWSSEMVDQFRGFRTRSQSLSSSIGTIVKSPNGFSTARRQMGDLHAELVRRMASFGFELPIPIDVMPPGWTRTFLKPLRFLDEFLGDTWSALSVIPAIADFTKCGDVPPFFEPQSYNLTPHGLTDRARDIQPQKLTIVGGCPDHPCNVSMPDVGEFEIGALGEFEGRPKSDCLATGTANPEWVIKADHYEWYEQWQLLVDQDGVPKAVGNSIQPYTDEFLLVVDWEGNSKGYGPYEVVINGEKHILSCPDQVIHEEYTLTP